MSNVAVILMDMQEQYLAEVEFGKVDPLVESQLEVLATCIEKDIPVALVENLPELVSGFDYGETDGRLLDIYRSIRRKSTFKKDNPDAFTNPRLEKQLERWGSKKLIFIGLYFSQCILASGKSAADKFEIYTAGNLVADLKGDDPANRMVAARFFHKHGGFYSSHHSLDFLFETERKVIPGRYPDIYVPDVREIYALSTQR